jgi:hypothetical protein
MNCLTNETGALVLNTSRLYLELEGLNGFYKFNLLETINSSETGSPRPYDLFNYIGIGNCTSRNDRDKNCNPFKLVAIFQTPHNHPHFPHHIPHHNMEMVASPWQSAPTYISREKKRGRVLDYSKVPKFDVTNLFSSYNLDQSSILSSELLQSFAGSMGFHYHMASLSENTTEIELEMKNFLLYVDVYAKMDKMALLDLQSSQLGVLGCVGSTFDTIQINSVYTNLSQVQLNINYGDLSFDATNVTNKVLPYIEDFIMKRLNKKVETMLSHASEVCANDGNVVLSDDNYGSNDSDDESLSPLVIGVVITAAIILAILVAYYSYRYVKIANKDDEIVSEMDIQPLIYTKFEDAPTVPVGTSNIFCGCFWCVPDFRYFDGALIEQDCLPLWLRVTLLVGICGNIGLYMDSNASKAVSIIGIGTIYSDFTDTIKIEPAPFFDFTLKSTVQDSKLSKTEYFTTYR